MDQRVAGLQAHGLQLYRDAREAGQYEVAYHALCAALHAAEAGRRSRAATKASSGSWR